MTDRVDVPAPILPEGIPTTVADAVRRAARLWPGTEAFVNGDRRLTFGALSERVARGAAALAALGVRRGDHMALCLGNTDDWLVLFLAGCALGAVTVAVNTRLKAQEIAYMLRQSDARFLFVDDRLLGIDFIAMLREICPAIDRELPGPDLPCLAKVVVIGGDVPAACLPYTTFKAGAALPDVSVPDDVALIQYTSGTTSFPKGAMLFQQSILGVAWHVGACMGFRPGDRHLSTRPFFHVAGSVLSVLVAVLHGCTLVTMTRFEPAGALALAESERCTHISGNDTMFLMMLGEPDLPRRRLAVRGGMLACSPPVVRRVMEAMGATEVVTGYGLSEASPNIFETLWSDPVEDRLDGWAHPHPGLLVRIADPVTGETVPPDSSGEIRVRGWSLMREYYRKPEETAAALGPDRELRTGDFGRMRADGKVCFIGRLKEIIRVGGENVAPADIENVLHQHPAVKQAQVVGVPDPRLTEVPAAFLILNDGAEADEDALLAWSRQHMANFKVPRYLAIVDSFDDIGMTASAKIQKSKLAAHARQRFGLAS